MIRDRCRDEKPTCITGAICESWVEQGRRKNCTITTGGAGYRHVVVLKNLTPHPVKLEFTTDVAQDRIEFRNKADESWDDAWTKLLEGQPARPQRADRECQRKGTDEGPDDIRVRLTRTWYWSALQEDWEGPFSDDTVLTISIQTR